MENTTGAEQRKQESGFSDGYSDAQSLRPIAIATALVACIVLVRLPWRSSFWADEAITWWLIKDSPADLWHRVITYQGQSPFYYAIVWLSSRMFGLGELALRLPSAFFAVLAASLTYALAKRLTGRKDLALIAFSLCISSDNFLRAAVSARPYAFAIVFTLGAMHATLSAIRRPTAWRVVTVACWVLAAFYSHYLFLAICVPIVCVFLLKSIPLRQWALFAVLVLGGIVPATPHLFSLYTRASELSFAARPHGSALLQGFVAIPVFAAVIVGLVLGYIWGGFPRRSRVVDTLAFVLPFAVLPPMLFLGADIALGSSLWVPRYWSWQIVPMAIVLTVLLTTVSARGYRAAILGTFAMLVLRVASQVWVVEDWRGVAEQVRPTRPIALFSGLIEAEGDPAGRTDEMNEYLAAPLRVYGVPGTITVLGLRRPEHETAELLAASSQLVTLRTKRGEYRSPDRFIEMAKSLGISPQRIVAPGEEAPAKLVELFSLSGSGDSAP